MILTSELEQVTKNGKKVRSSYFENYLLSKGNENVLIISLAVVLL